jgi:hypothetical protein
LLTPVRLKSDTGWIGEDELSLVQLVQASIRRLNLLSDCYGNRRSLSSYPWIEFAVGLPEIRRALQWDRSRRRSTSQGADLALSGVVGEIHLAALPHPILELLSAATLFHVGQKTVEGCGCFRLIPLQPPTHDYQRGILHARGGGGAGRPPRLERGHNSAGLDFGWGVL